MPGWQDPAKRDDTILINAAYDRAGLRFGHDYGYFLAQMAQAVRDLGELAEVQYVAHSLDDEKIVFDLRREHGISMPVIPLYDFENKEILDLYARTRLVIGMRGHAGMIPFGVGTPDHQPDLAPEDGVLPARHRAARVGHLGPRPPPRPRAAPAGGGDPRRPRRGGGRRPGTCRSGCGR